MGYFVSRQYSYPDGDAYVELETGGLDYASPGMLKPWYEGEGFEFDDPREAARAAVAVMEAWKHDDEDLEVLFSVGTTGGGLACHVPDHWNGEEVLAWGEREYAQRPKCDRCGDVIPEGRFGDPAPYRIVDDPDFGDFCSGYCAEAAYEEDLSREFAAD